MEACNKLASNLQLGCNVASDEQVYIEDEHPYSGLLEEE